MYIGGINYFIMETFIKIFSFIILYLLIGLITWCIIGDKKYNIEDIHIFMFALFWPIILLAILFKYIIFSIKELYKFLEKLYHYEWHSKNKQ